MELGPQQGETANVRTVVDKILREWPDLDVNYATNENGPHEAQRLELDCSKAANELDWQPVLSLTDAITMTLKLYRTAMNEPDLLKPNTLSQIQAYEERLHGAIMEMQHE